MFVFTVDESEFCTSADPGFDPELQEKHNELPFATTPTAQRSSQSFLELLHAPVSPATSTQSTSSAKKVTVKKIKASPEAEIVQVQKEILLKLTELTTVTYVSKGRAPMRSTGSVEQPTEVLSGLTY